MENFTAIVSALTVIVTIIVTGLSPVVSTNVRNSKVKSEFRDDIKKGLLADNLTYKDLQHIAEYHQLNRQDILYSLRAMLAKAVRGEDELTDITPYIRTLLEEHQQKEPFAELPENISLQLSDIKAEATDKKINQLAASLSTIYITNQRESEKEKIMSRAGFLVGLAGVVLTIAFFFLTRPT